MLKVVKSFARDINVIYGMWLREYLELFQGHQNSIGEVPF
jgi:hypothetical protein